MDLLKPTCLAPAPQASPVLVDSRTIPRWVLQRDDAISPDFVVALWWWGGMERKKNYCVRGWER